MANPFPYIPGAHKRGYPWGITSVCSANRYVLEAAMLQAEADDSFLLVESTSNQVDQFGGYTGMTPAAFVRQVYQIAESLQFPVERIFLGGDHLGPNVWQGETAEKAMANAGDQIAAYVEAGYTKIHLDTSMRCADDPGGPLIPEIAAGRAAELCLIAEKTFVKSAHHSHPPVYVIGTEVPIPGGAREELSRLQPSTVEDTAMTIDITRRAFLKHNLEAAWERVIAVVVQPGVEFGDSTVVEYDRAKARALSRFIETHEKLVYEAHSTDYQSPIALRQLVEDHFAILKVGPWLTFAFREAVFALAAMESECYASRKDITLSAIRETIERVMQENPRYWQEHYHGTETQQLLARKYSFSDRIRYYWADPAISAALNQLIDNLTAHPPPPALLSQYMPLQYQALREHRLHNTPIELIHHKIMEVTAIYSRATRAAKTKSIF